MNYWTVSEFDAAAPYTSGPKMNLYNYGVGEAEGSFAFVEHNTNPGQGQLATSDQTIDDKKTTTYEIRVITLDALAKARGWFENRVDIAILKVDVEGLEYKVIEGAKELLKTKMIRHVFTEVSARTDEEGDLNIPFINYMVEAGYRLYQIGGWMGPNEHVNWKHDENLAALILNVTKTHSAKQLNLWWTADDRYPTVTYARTS